MSSDQINIYQYLASNTNYYAPIRIFSQPYNTKYLTSVAAWAGQSSIDDRTFAQLNWNKADCDGAAGASPTRGAESAGRVGDTGDAGKERGSGEVDGHGDVDQPVDSQYGIHSGVLALPGHIW
jgi:hypothetical protein